MIRSNVSISSSARCSSRRPCSAIQLYEAKKAEGRPAQYRRARDLDRDQVVMIAAGMGPRSSSSRGLRALAPERL